MSIKPVILCGGSGQRLWPESRKKLPKQFINLFNEETLFELTLSRIKSLKNFIQPFIVTNEEYRFYVANSLKKCSVDAICINEPLSKNTTAAIYLSAKLSKPNDELLIMPSDHFIKETTLFSNIVTKSYEEKKYDQFIVFGVQPKSPHTGYGYIEVSSNSNNNQSFLKKVSNFKEKPNKNKAEQFINNGYLWNAGIFMCKSQTIIDSINKFAPKISRYCDIAIKKMRYSKDKKNIYFMSQDFEKIPSASIDYSVIEKANNVFCAPLKVDWSDLGDWDSFSNQFIKNDSNNKIVQIDSQNNFIKSSGRVISTIGIKDTIIVDTDDALLISKKNKTSKVKTIVEKLIKNEVFEALENNFELRPWGKFENILETSFYKIKKLTISPKSRLSLQFHKFRSEHWFVIEGTATITLNKKEYKLKKGNSIDIPRKAVHQINNKSSKELIIIEIQLGNYFGEDDIIRLDDPYAR